MSGDLLAQYFSIFLKGERKVLCEPQNCWNYIPQAAIFLNHFNQCFPPWMTWLVFYQGKPFSQLEAGAILWPPTMFSGCIVIPWMGDSFCAGLYLQFTAAFLYMCISRQRENRTLVFVNSCMWSHTFISNWTLCFCGGYFILFFFPLAERTDGVYATLLVNEIAGTSQDYRVLYDYTAQVKKGFKINTLCSTLK